MNRCTRLAWVLPATLLAFAIVGLQACGGGKTPSSSAPEAKPETAPASATAAAAPLSAVPSQSATDEAKNIFATRCTPCHGPEGHGDGAASAGLTPPPRNFSDPAWQASVTDEHVEKIIKFGGAAVGKSAAMPNNPDLMAKPEVVAALRAHVRGLKQQ